MTFRKQREITGHSAAIYCCAAHQKFIYSGSADKYVARWLINEGIQDAFAIRFEQAVYAIEIIDENILAVGVADGKLYFFDIEQRKELKCYTQHTVAIFSIRCNPHKRPFPVAFFRQIRRQHLR